MSNLSTKRKFIALSPIRDYFTKQFKALDPSFKEHREAMSADTLADTKLDRAFQIVPGDLSPGDQRNTSKLSLKVKVYFDSGKDSQASYWNGYEAAMIYKNMCMDVENMGNATGICGIQFNGISPSSLDQNARGILFEINFVVITLSSVDADFTT